MLYKSRQLHVMKCKGNKTHLYEVVEDENRNNYSNEERGTDGDDDDGSKNHYPEREGPVDMFWQIVVYGLYVQTKSAKNL